MRELDKPPSELTEYRRPQQRLVLQTYSDSEPTQASGFLSQYFLVIWRQRWKILTFVATAMLAAYVTSTRLRPVYEATAKIDIEHSLPTGAAGSEPSRAHGNDDPDEFIATQMEILQSDAVLRPVAERYRLLEREGQIESRTSETIRRKNDAPVVLKHLKVTRPANTYLLDVTYRSTEPQLAADVANSIAQSYLAYSLDTRTKANSAQGEFMQNQLDDLKARMERFNLALDSFQQRTEVVKPEDQANTLSSRLLQLNVDYTRAQADRMAKESALKAANTGAVTEVFVTDQADFSRLQEHVNTAQQHLADVAAVYGPNHAEYQKARREFEQVQRQFEELHTNASLRANADYQKAVKNESALRRAVQSATSEYDRLNSTSFEYQQLSREAEADKALYSDLERKIREATISSGSRSNSIRLADAARPPDEPVFPNKNLSLLFAFLVSSMLGMGIAVIADLMDHTIRDPEQAAHSLGTGVLGVLPSVKEIRRLTAGSSMESKVLDGLDEFSTPAYDSLMMIRYNAEEAARKAGKKKALVRITTPVSEAISSYEEAIRALRHSILLPDLDRTMKSILITSATPGEGKSTAIIHLAIAHAEQGKRTLIIDADLRRPSIHKKLGVSGTLGLSNILLGEFEWREMVIKIEEWPNLDIIPAGMISRRASDLVGSMMIEILDEASRRYDLILVDAPPLLGFAEAMQVAKAVDGVVVIARARQTSKRAVATVLATLKRLRANVVGLVLNEVTTANAGGHYSYDNYRH